MKKFLAILLAACALTPLAACGGCNQESQPQQINMSFGQTEAYFTGRTELYPISGDTPAADDPVERAVVSLNADSAVVMRLSLQYDEGAADIPGLVVSVNGTAAVDISDGMILYTSPVAETKADVNVAIYLEQGSPASNAGKTLQFSFELGMVD